MFKSALALTALLSAASAHDLQALPSWTVDSKCKKSVLKERDDVAKALKDMPDDAAHKMVAKSVAGWYLTVGKLCHTTKKGFYCPGDVQDQMWTAYNRMVYAVRQANTPQATRVYNEIVETNYTLSHCAKLVQDSTVMMKLLVPADSSSKWHEVEFDMRKFNQSPHSAAILAQMEEWRQATGAQAVISELDDALALLDEDDEIDLEMADTSSWGSISSLASLLH